MDTKFFNGLFEGDSPTGIKLGMGLTGGDFWPRTTGCLHLYRGSQWWEIDYAAIVTVGDAGADRIVSRADHLAGDTWFFVVRSVNGCGEEDLNASTMVRLTFDAAGDLQLAAGRNVIALRVAQVAPLAVRLAWLHSPYHAPAPCERFDVYFDDGSGAIDFEHPVASVPCTGAGAYSHELFVPQPGTYRFCVRCRSQAGPANGTGVYAAVAVALASPQGLGQLNVRVI